MAKHPIIQDLETRFLKRLENYAEAVRGEFPNVEVEVWSSSVGSLTDDQGHNIGIDCIIPDVPLDRPNCVALIIDVMHLTTKPELYGAEVVWCHPSGTNEAELFDGIPQPCNEANIAAVEDGLDGLVAALREALRRGVPSDWPEC